MCGPGRSAEDSQALPVYLRWFMAEHCWLLMANVDKFALMVNITEAAAARFFDLCPKKPSRLGFTSRLKPEFGPVISHSAWTSLYKKGNNSSKMANKCRCGAEVLGGENRWVVEERSSNLKFRLIGYIPPEIEVFSARVPCWMLSRDRKCFPTANTLWTWAAFLHLPKLWPTSICSPIAAETMDL